MTSAHRVFALQSKPEHMPKVNLEWLTSKNTGISLCSGGSYAIIPMLLTVTNQYQVGEKMEDWR